MKKLFTLLLALVLCLSTAGAEYGVIGGADGPTAIVVSAPEFVLPGSFDEAAVAAGRRAVGQLRVKELTGVSTGVAEIDAAINDMIAALGINTYSQGDESGMALTISDAEVLNFAAALSGKDLYLKSNLLGKALVVGSDEVEGLFNRLLDMCVMMQALTASDAEAIKASFEGAFGAFGAVYEQMNASMLTEADLLAMDYSALVNVLGGIVENTKPVEAIVIPGNCDPAAAGFVMTMTNEDAIAVCKAIIQVLKDNPRLMTFVANQIGYMTQEQLDALWAGMETQYEGISKEEFLASYPNFSTILEEVLAELEGQKLLDGDMTIHIYHDEAYQTVYMTIHMPLFIAQETVYTYADYDEEWTTELADPADQVGETVVVDMVYTRQTVAQGVSHVVNLTVDGETVTADTLISGNTAHIVLSAPDAEPVIIDAAVEGNSIHAVLTCNPDDATEIVCTFDGSYLCTAERYELTGKLTVQQEYTPAQSEVPTYNGLTLPGYAANAPKPETNTLGLEISAVYDRNGVDYNGVTELIVTFNDIRAALEIKAWTEDPAESIMAGSVVRPAEMDDATFNNWFVEMVNNISAWLGNLMMALPESVLTLFISGMM